MREAAEEEKRIAINKRSYHDGVPAISVIVDGGWSKRSHKHSYNAKSGVGIIIGCETKKLLHIGVRNKYCSVCAQKGKDNTSHREHNCYKNWEGSSSSMESDIILDGFKEAEIKYGLRYTTFTADGDTLVYPNLITGVPMWGHAIQKVECANHAIKCYRSSLEKLVEEKPHYKGKGKLTEAMRKRLTKAARCAIKMRSTEANRREAVKLLREDLCNGPFHCFGDHRNCSKDYCKVVREQENNSLVVTSESTPASSIEVATPVDDPMEVEPEAHDSSETAFIDDIAEQEQRMWEDALEDDLDDVQSVPCSSDEIDRQLMCDLQQLVARLIAKAEQLIGKCSASNNRYKVSVGLKIIA